MFDSFSQGNPTNTSDKPCTIKYYSRNRYKIGNSDSLIKDYRLGGWIRNDYEAYKEYKVYNKYSNAAGITGLLFMTSLVFTTVRMIQGKNVFPYVAFDLGSFMSVRILSNKADPHLRKAIAIYNAHL